LRPRPSAVKSPKLSKRRLHKGLAKPKGKPSRLRFAKASVPPKAALPLRRRLRRCKGGGRADDAEEEDEDEEEMDVRPPPAPLPPLGPLGRAAAVLRSAAPAVHQDGSGAEGQEVEACGLVGREVEQQAVLDFLRAGVEAGGAREVLYVSGMPGTGKTASLLEAVHRLKSGRDRCRTRFTFVHINAMCLSAPGAVFAELCRKIPAVARACRGKGQLSEGQAHAALTQHFSEAEAAASSEDAPKKAGGHRPRQTVVLLLDEVDCLVTQAQTVLYRLFDWLSIPGARLVLAAIANTMDLPERLLPRVASRLGVRRVNFTPYDRVQLKAILVERLIAGRVEKVFTEDALTLCSARIAGASGDARKALQVCRRAIEVRLRAVSAQAQDAPPTAGDDDAATGGGSSGDDDFEDAKGPVGVSEIARAEADLMRGNPAARAVAGLSLKARRFLLAVVLELRQSPEATALPLRTAVRRYEGLMTLAEREATPSQVRGQDAATGVASCEQPAAAAPPLQSHAEDALHCLRRLEAMSLLHGPAEGCDAVVNAFLMEGAAAGGAGPRIEVGGTLDADDIADALLGAPEEDFLAKDLLGGGASAAAATAAPAAEAASAPAAEASAAATAVAPTAEVAAEGGA